MLLRELVAHRVTGGGRRRNCFWASKVQAWDVWASQAGTTRAAGGVHLKDASQRSRLPNRLPVVLNREDEIATGGYGLVVVVEGLQRIGKIRKDAIRKDWLVLAEVPPL
jgi:hypothetical protein